MIQTYAGDHPVLQVVDGRMNEGLSSKPNASSGRHSVIRRMGAWPASGLKAPERVDAQANAQAARVCHFPRISEWRGRSARAQRGLSRARQGNLSLGILLKAPQVQHCSARYAAHAELA